eukprot:821985_1
MAGYLGSHSDWAPPAGSQGQNSPKPSRGRGGPKRGRGRGRGGYGGQQKSFNPYSSGGYGAEESSYGADGGYGAPGGYGGDGGYGAEGGYGASGGYSAPGGYGAEESSYGADGGYGAPGGYGGDGGYGAEGGYGASGGYSAPGGYGAEESSYGADGGYGAPGGYGGPGGYGAEGDYGAEGGYGAKGGYGAEGGYGGVSDGGYGQQQSRMQGSSNTNLYVAGFPSTWNKVQLEQLFSTFGSITSARITTFNNATTAKQTNGGTGFVHFLKPCDAQQAKITMANTSPPELFGGKLTVRFANASKNFVPASPLTDMRLDPNQDGGAPIVVSRRIVKVSNLPSDFSTAKLATLFEPLGRMEQLKMLATAPSDASTATGQVEYAVPEVALSVIAQLDGTVPDGCQAPIRVEFAEVPRDQLPPVFTESHVAQLQSLVNLYVTQLPNTFTQGQIQQIFSQFGEIRNIVAKPTRGSQQNRQVAFIHYCESRAAIKAVSMLKDSQPAGCVVPIGVDFAKAHASVLQRLNGQRGGGGGGGGGGRGRGGRGRGRGGRDMPAALYGRGRGRGGFRGRGRGRGGRGRGGFGSSSRGGGWPGSDSAPYSRGRSGVPAALSGFGGGYPEY